MSPVSSQYNSASLSERVHNALAVTPALITDIIGQTCRRCSSQSQNRKTKRIGQLIDINAWTDAALSLIELELPQWQVRRIAYDDGEWYCALSRERDLPDWLDQSVEGRHADLALAILSAFVEVQGLNTEAPQTSVPPAPQATHLLYEPQICDSFA
jgi:hypothetical protein